MEKLNVKKGDTVMVISGKDKNKTGKVLAAYAKTGKIRVEGINMISKSKKPKNAQDKGGIVKMEGTIDSSNVMPVCPKCGDVVRVRHQETVDEKGNKKSIRICSKCGAPLDVKQTAKKAAKKAAKKKAEKTAADETPVAEAKDNK